MEQKRGRSSKTSPKSGESFKEQILRNLEEGNQERKSAASSERKRAVQARQTPSRSQKKEGVKQNVPKKVQKRRQERVRRKTETSLQKEERVVRKVTRRIIIALVLFFVVAGASGYFYVHSALQPLDKHSTTFVNVHIPERSSTKQIAQILEKQKIIKNACMFCYFVKFHNYSSLQSGYYNLKASDTLKEIAETLKKGGTKQPEKPILGKVVIKEGQNITEIAEQIEINVNTKKGEKTPFKSADFLALMKDEAFFKEMQQKYPKLLNGADDSPDIRYRFEGYLYPATYSYEKNDTIRTVAERMVATMNQVMTEFYAEIEKQGKTVKEVLTLASLVESEAAGEEDRRMIAQVFLNRLKIDMPLQTDVAVLYALNKKKEVVSIEDTKVDSPYNLYKNPGIGPGPYDSPSKPSIEAALDPKENEYLFFVADIKTKKVYYSKTYEEHQSLVEKYANHSEGE